MDGLQLRGGVVRYGSTTAVAGVDLRVRRGEVVALLGPSGCGKSSLLRAVAGLEPLAAGELTWDGADMTGVPVHRRGFGLMFQDGQLFPHRDVAGNVVYGLQMAGMPRAAQRERVAELHARGMTEARLYGANQNDGVGGTGSVFLLLDEPETYGLPPDPRVPTADLPQMFSRAGWAAAGMLATAALAFLGRRR